MESKQLKDVLEESPWAKDSLLRACDLILSENKVSISLLQRRLKMGYSKAGALLDMLEDLGVITPFDGVHARGIHTEQILKIKTVLMGD